MEERRKNEELRMLLDVKSRTDSLWRHHTEDRILQRLHDLETFRDVITDRGRNDAVFTDDQVKRIKELFDERAEVHAGRLAFRGLLWSIGAAVAGSATTLLAYFGLRK